MIAAKDESRATTSDAAREISTTRLFDAPRDLVFQMWTDPQHVGQWFGPTGFTITIHEMDVRPGGAWRFTMHGPDGVDYPNEIVYREIERPALLSYTQGPSPVFNVLITFAEQGRKTVVTARMFFATAEDRTRVVEEFGAIEGLNQTMDRLGETLSRVYDASEEFVLTRVFDAPRDLVFRAWTEAERLAEWWGPKGFRTFSCTIDLRPGGKFHYGMQSASGDEMWGRFVFREVVPPERMVFVLSFSDPQGGITRAPFAENWPREILNNVTFTESGGKTTVTMRGYPINATEEERKVYKAGHTSMQGGFGSSFTQLDEYLASAKGQAR